MSEMVNYTHNLRRRTGEKRRFLVRVVIFLFCTFLGFFCAYKTTVHVTQTMAVHVTQTKAAQTQRTETPQTQRTVAAQTQTTAPQAEKTEALQTNQPTSEVDTSSATARFDTSATTQFSTSAQLNSANAILIDRDSWAVLFDRHGTEKMYPASMTKILTAVVAIEHISDLETMIVLNETIFQPIYNADAVTAGFLPGESVRAVDLLYGLLLPSGAECAVGLAEYVAGSEGLFVGMMNEKAREIGMTDSHFTNATGLHDENHYSTAMDMATLLHYALANDMFYSIITSPRYAVPSTDRHSDGITFHSTFFSRITSPAFDGGSILGGKTGFTNEAGQCLASFAEKQGKNYILVTAGAAGNNQTQTLHIDDAFAIYSAIR